MNSLAKRSKTIKPHSISKYSLFANRPIKIIFVSFHFKIVRIDCDLKSAKITVCYIAFSSARKMPERNLQRAPLKKNIVIAWMICIRRITCSAAALRPFACAGNVNLPAKSIFWFICIVSWSLCRSDVTWTAAVLSLSCLFLVSVYTNIICLLSICCRGEAFHHISLVHRNELTLSDIRQKTQNRWAQDAHHQHWCVSQQNSSGATNNSSYEFRTTSNAHRIISCLRARNTTFLWL